MRKQANKIVNNLYYNIIVDLGSSWFVSLCRLQYSYYPHLKTSTAFLDKLPGKHIDVIERDLE